MVSILFSFGCTPKINKLQKGVKKNFCKKSAFCILFLHYLIGFIKKQTIPEDAP
jgi:hypothetical protein